MHRFSPPKSPSFIENYAEMGYFAHTAEKLYTPGHDTGDAMGENFSFSTVLEPFYTPEQLERIAGTTIGIAGAGGIGSNVALMLIRSGFSRLVLVDFDTVAASNLNRQAYGVHHIGKSKVLCLQELCRAINPEALLNPINERIDQTNVGSVFGACDVIIEAFDDAASKALLFSCFLPSKKIVVGASGIAGIGRTDRIVIREIRKNCFIVGDEQSAVSDTEKPFAPRVMVAAAKMADIVLEKVLGSFASG